MDFPWKTGVQGGNHGRVDQSCVTVAPVACASHGHGCAMVGWTLQLQGGMWDGQGCPLIPLLVAWKDLAPSPALTVLGTAQLSWLLSGQILGSQGFSITEAPGEVLSHLPCLLERSFPWPGADPAPRPGAVHFLAVPVVLLCSFVQDVGLVFFPGLLFPASPVQHGWVPVVCLTDSSVSRQRWVHPIIPSR